MRPSEVEAADLAQDLHQMALLGPHGVFDTEEGVHREVRGSILVLEQQTASLSVDEEGSVVVRQPAARRLDSFVLPALIEEDVQNRVARALRLTASILDRIDPVQRLTHSLPAVGLEHLGGYGWRTQEEQLRSPNQMAISSRSGGSVVVTLKPPIRPRPSLTHEVSNLAMDFVVLLRRELR
jgi:hypothetical protein